MIDLKVSFFEPRGAIDCAIKTDNGTIRVVATHLGLLPNERRQQLSRLEDVLSERKRDLHRAAGRFQHLRTGAAHALRRLGTPRRMPRLFTFPSRRPLMSLDRI